MSNKMSKEDASLYATRYLLSTFPPILFSQKQKDQAPVVLWKMRAPEKKPLVRREKPDEAKQKIRKGSQKKKMEPVKELADFEQTF